MARWAWCAAALAALGCGRVGFDAQALEVADAAATLDAGCAAPATGLLGYWPMDTADLQGTTLVDRSGNARDGMLTAVTGPLPVLSTGRFGQALDYTSTNQAYVDVANLPVTSTPGAFTSVSLWFRHDDPNPDEVLIYLPPGPGTVPPRYDLWLTNQAGGVHLCINTGAGDCWGIADPSFIGRWVHVVAVFANGPTVDGSLYVDGVAAPMACRFGTCNQTRAAMQPVHFGGSDSTYAWHGLLDEVRIYDRALTAGEALALFECPP